MSEDDDDEAAFEAELAALSADDGAFVQGDDAEDVDADADDSDDEPDSLQLLRAAMERRERAMEEFGRDLQQAHQHITRGAPAAGDDADGGQAVAAAPTGPSAGAADRVSGDGSGGDARLGSTSFLPDSAMARAALVRALFAAPAAAEATSGEAAPAAAAGSAVSGHLGTRGPEEPAGTAGEFAAATQPAGAGPGTGGAEAVAAAARERRLLQLQQQLDRCRREEQDVEGMQQDLELQLREAELEQRRVEQAHAEELQLLWRELQLQQQRQQLQGQGGIADEQCGGPGGLASDGGGPSSACWTPDIVQGFANFLPPNEVPCTLRQVNKATAALFRGRQHTTILPSEPVPHHEFGISGGAVRSLSFKHRQQLLHGTAASGVIANLEVLDAWGDYFHLAPHTMAEAAVAGQLEVCRWLKARGCSTAIEHFPAVAGAGRKYPFRVVTDEHARVMEVVTCCWFKALPSCTTTTAFPGLPAGFPATYQDVCEWLLDNGDDHVWDNAHHTRWAAEGNAASGGHVDLLEWLQVQWRHLRGGGSRNARSLLWGTARGCNLPTLQRVLRDWADSAPEPLLPWEARQLVYAAGSSATPDWKEKVLWLQGQGYSPSGLLESGNIMDTMLELSLCPLSPELVSSLDRVQWLLAQGFSAVSELAPLAARLGRVDVLEHMLGKVGLQLTQRMAAMACSAAAQHGSRACLEVLQTYGHLGSCGSFCSTLADAAQRGDLASLAWLVDAMGSSAKLSEVVFGAAAASGSIQIMEWLHERGCPWGASTFVRAVAKRNLQAMGWLHERGCPWDARAFKAATSVAVGGVELLAWLHARGCLWDASVLESAAAACNTAQLEWLVAQGCPMPDIGRPYESAARNKDMPTLRCLKRLGFPIVPGCATFTHALLQPSERRS
ncbi:hypothetical protein TSOC_004465 [Tetrabaena socialis]|uniref:Ankyrin repeat domain-containing protein n=1 Tax=Tetrabaena socialis TaxID=47790 RepID=A0A2J8A8W3_9CHLO|nr:hypothetical protein TSOC_004465 [Tetrabaena socialis]|eukprot:PNH08941.1 hypothetical protein TSOC_004465 [Tetrabaena socialis]